jgi:hypothetical protein
MGAGAGRLPVLWLTAAVAWGFGETGTGRRAVERSGNCVRQGDG